MVVMLTDDILKLPGQTPAGGQAAPGAIMGQSEMPALGFVQVYALFQVPGEQKDWLIPVGEHHFLLAGVFGSTVEFVDGGAGDGTLVFHLPSGNVRMTKN